MDLQALRGEINEIDGEILRLFLRRMEVVREVVGYKAAHGLPVLQPARETEVLAWVGERAGEEMEPYARALFETLMSLSRDMQEKILKAQ